MKKWYLCPMEQVTEPDGFTFWRPRIARYPVAWTVDDDEPDAALVLVLAGAPDLAAVDADSQCVPLPTDQMTAPVGSLPPQVQAQIRTAARARGLSEAQADERVEQFLLRFGRRGSPTFDPRRMNVKDV
jgi:hypothetical protein